MQQLHFDARAGIFSPNAANKQVFILKKGFVLAYTYDDRGSRQIHVVYGPGTYFPVITTFIDRHQQRAFYEAFTACQLDVYDKDEFVRAVESDHAFCKLILITTVAQIKIFADRVLSFETAGLDNKIVHRLVSLAEAHGRKIGTKYILPYPITHEIMAQMLGVQRESISRAIGRLKKAGKISMDVKDNFIIIV